MKRIFNCIIVALLLATVGCVENEIDRNCHDGANELVASIVRAETKTSLSEVSAGLYKPVWDEGDCIGVMIDGAEIPVPYVLSEGAGTSVGKFKGNGKGHTYVAYYPYDGVAGLDGDVLNIVLPSVQSFKKGSFGSEAYPMVAISQTEKMEFFNICSVLKLSIKGSGELSSIVFRTNSENMKASGDASISVNSSSELQLTMFSNASSEIVLDCAGVLLNESEATDFHIVVPAQTYVGGFTVQINSPSGVMEKITKGDVHMMRSQLRAIPEFVFEPYEEPFFEIPTSRFEVGPHQSEISVDVKTNMTYSISSMPDWIEEVSVTETSYGYTHVFAVSQNTEPVSREGIIVFCNENQVCVPVTVVQDEGDSVGEEWKSKEFYHRSLAMRFTADWCGYCPTMATSVEYAKALIPDKIEAVSMHPSGGLAFSGAYDLVSRFQISGFPSLIMDSRALVQNYSSSYASQLIKSVVEETESAYPASTGISFKSSLDGMKLTADVNLYIKEAGDYKVTVLLLEDNIVGYQNGAGDSYVHNGVVRLALSGIDGDDINVGEDDTVWSGRFTGTVPSICSTTNLRLLVYVEKPFGNQTVAQGVSNVVYGSYGDTYVDNCRSEAVGKKAELQYADDETIGGLYESTDYSADGQVVTLQKASYGNGIDIVLMGDAYSDRLIADGTYAEVMNTAYEKFFSVEPYKSYRDLFNVYYVNVVSKNEIYGAETALEGYFGDGTHVGGNDQTCFDYALNAITEDRMGEAVIIVMMNSTAYAGTCYMYYGYSGDYGNGTSVSYFPVGSDDEQLGQVLHHEAGGHGFAKLADEYAYESMGAVPADHAADIRSQQVDLGWWKNVDFTSDPSLVRWAGFLEDSRYAGEGLGCFEGGLTYWTGVWRPTDISIMRYNTGGFNAPSREAIWYRIQKLAYGNNWTYDYEDFVEYDSVNRTATVRSGHKNYVEMPPVMTAPPVVTGKYWRDER